MNASSNEFDLALVIAQLAVAFAGFASISSAFSSRGELDETRVDAGRLTNMLITSLSTAMLALVPAVIGLFEVAEAWAWRSASLLALALLAAFMPGVLRRTRSMKRYAGFNVVSNTTNIGIAVVGGAFFVACAVGLPASRPAASYVAGLMALLVVSAIVFFRVIASLLRPHAPD